MSFAASSSQDLAEVDNGETFAELPQKKQRHRRIRTTREAGGANFFLKSSCSSGGEATGGDERIERQIKHPRIPAFLWS